MLSYLQMNSVPRVDSPRVVPLHSVMADDQRLFYTPRMLTNEVSNQEPPRTLVCYDE